MWIAVAAVLIALIGVAVTWKLLQRRDFKRDVDDVRESPGVIASALDNPRG